MGSQSSLSMLVDSAAEIGFWLGDPVWMDEERGPDGTGGKVFLEKGVQYQRDFLQPVIWCLRNNGHAE